MARKRANSNLNLSNLSDKFIDLDFQRKSAKTLMATSLGLLCFSALGKGKFYKNLHIISGVTLVGSAIWHHNLYKTKYSKYLKERKE
ncbi:MAG: hypothetical protein IJ211_03615 [Campylobacter sp.]|nr:hypothetical protein [Campylobacter sp.]